MTSCVLMENPHGEGVDPTEVSVMADIHLDVYLPGTEAEPVSDNSSAFRHRFIIEAVADNGATHARDTLFCPLEQQKVNCNLRLSLHARHYNLLVWSDYAVADDAHSPFHDASSLSPVIALINSREPSEFKDCFYNSVALDLRSHAGQWNSTLPVSVALRRPVGRFELIATDARAFLRYISEDSSKGKEFKARISYSGLYATSFNVLNGFAGELTNHSFELPVRCSEDDAEALIAFDYVLVAPEGENVPLRIDIINEKGTMLACTAVRVPMQRNLNTRVRGRFLTNTTEGGIVIDPSFDDEIDIDLGPI